MTTKGDILKWFKRNKTFESMGPLERRALKSMWIVYINNYLNSDANDTSKNRKLFRVASVVIDGGKYGKKSEAYQRFMEL